MAGKFPLNRTENDKGLETQVQVNAQPPRNQMRRSPILQNLGMKV